MPKYFRYSNVLIYFSISFSISCYQSRCASLIGACEYLLRKILINQIDSLAQKRIHIKSKHALCTVRINVQIQLQTQKISAATCGIVQVIPARQSTIQNHAGISGTGLVRTHAACSSSIGGDAYPPFFHRKALKNA